MPKTNDPKLNKTNSAASNEILETMRSQSDLDSNAKVVALSLSFPTIIRTPQSDSRNSSYVRFSADC